MNYILHLNKTFEKFCEDERLTPFHVSLYFSLFQYWNMARFRNPISVSRDELMRSSKIGSVNTYIRCMKELDKWAYIQYIPSYNPQKGSQVYLYNFNNSNNNASDISNNKGSDKAPKKTTGKAGEKPMIPSINNTNISNKTNNVNGSKPTIKKVIIKKSLADDNSKKQKEKLRQKKNKKSVGSGLADKPTSKSVATYFAKKKLPAIEGQKFFNHYESNGWLVGGKTPMKNWQAAANNWMLNAEKFINGKTKSTAGKLQAKTGKDYNEAL
jgi:hypothetical protein